MKHAEGAPGNAPTRERWAVGTRGLGHHHFTTLQTDGAEGEDTRTEVAFFFVQPTSQYLLSLLPMLLRDWRIGSGLCFLPKCTNRFPGAVDHPKRPTISATVVRTWMGTMGKVL